VIRMECRSSLCISFFFFIIIIFNCVRIIILFKILNNIIIAYSQRNDLKIIIFYRRGSQGFKSCLLVINNLLKEQDPGIT